MRKFIYFFVVLAISLSFASCRGTRTAIVEMDPFSLTDTEFREHLESTRKYSEIEILGFLQVKKEVEQKYGGKLIGKIVLLHNIHYVYRVDGIDCDGYQTINACGIWAWRRKMAHIIYTQDRCYGSHIRKDTWFKYSDREIRTTIAAFQNVPGEELILINGTGFIYHSAIVMLQIHFGIDPAYAEVLAIDAPGIPPYPSFRNVLYIYDRRFCAWANGHPDMPRPITDDHGFFPYDFDQADSLNCRALYRV
jgi:hypothetical protein